MSMCEGVDGCSKAESGESKEEADPYWTSDLTRDSKYVLERDAHPRANVGRGLLEQPAFVRQDKTPTNAVKKRHPELPFEHA
jgi:hypothetical protein